MSLHTTDLGDAGSRVVFCHGLFGQGKNWTQVAKHLSGRHRVTLVDMPNHGRSPWTDRFSYVEAADALAELLSADDPVALVGHSMGGKIAMLVALRHPGLVERQVVVDVAPVTYSSANLFSGFVHAMQWLDLGSLERREDADRALAADVPDPVVRSFLLQNLRRDGDSWRWQPNLDVLGRDLDVITGWPEDELAGVAPYEGPTVWVAGAESGYVRDAHTEEMERWFPKVRRVTVKDAGHWVHSEQPETFMSVLDWFLDGTGS